MPVCQVGKAGKSKAEARARAARETKTGKDVGPFIPCRTGEQTDPGRLLNTYDAVKLGFYGHIQGHLVTILIHFAAVIERENR